MKNRIGVKFKAPPNPFYRWRARRHLDISQRWQGRFEQEVYFFHNDGWGTETDLDLLRKISGMRWLRSSSSATYDDRENNYEFSQIFTLGNIIGPRRQINYQFGILGDSQPVPRVNDYFLSLHYSRGLYKDWLFLQVTPEVTFPRDDDHKPNPAITFRFEAFVTEH